MKRLTILILGMLLVALPAASAFAQEDEQMDKQEACDLLGNCGTDMVQSAKSMMVECEKMMATGKDLMAKGRAIMNQGKLWADKEMTADGQGLYDQGKKMFDEAKTMSDACALIIESGEKMKKKYKPKQKPEHDYKNPSGDFVP